MDYHFRDRVVAVERIREIRSVRRDLIWIVIIDHTYA